MARARFLVGLGEAGAQGLLGAGGLLAPRPLEAQRLLGRERLHAGLGLGALGRLQLQAQLRLALLQVGRALAGHLQLDAAAAHARRQLVPLSRELRRPHVGGEVRDQHRIEAALLEVLVDARTEAQRGRAVRALGGLDGGEVLVHRDDGARAALEQEARALALRGCHRPHLEDAAPGEQTLREDVAGQQFTGPQAPESGMHRLFASIAGGPWAPRNGPRK